MAPGPDLRRQLIAALARPGDQSTDFDLNPLVPPPSRILRPAAVLVGVMSAPGGAQLVLTKRASHLLHHPGQIAFPGGKQEATDACPAAAALREAHEEVGLDPALVEVLGMMPSHQTVTGFAVTPVLGWISAGFVARLEAGEVEEVFTVPLAHIAEPGNYRIETRIWQGQPRLYHTVPYGPYYIWGATARILLALAERLSDGRPAGRRQLAP